MPRYLIERTFSEKIDLPGPDQPDQVQRTFIENNTRDEVTWVYSYVAPDQNKSYCIYEAPTPEALRRAAQRNSLPVDRITEVRLLDPYRYAPE